MKLFYNISTITKFSQLSNLKYIQQYKSSMSIKKNITKPHSPVFINEKSKQPFCYYHKMNKITSFCVQRQCTLPLCLQCEKIHISQNKSHQTVSYQFARQRSIRCLLLKEQIIKNGINQIEDETAAIKKQLIKQIDFHLELYRQKYQLSKRYQILQKMKIQSQKIKQGSIKRLIQFYAKTQNEINQSAIQPLYFNLAALKNIFQQTIKINIKDRLKIITNTFNHKQLPEIYQKQKNQEEVINKMEIVKRQNINQKNTKITEQADEILSKQMYGSCKKNKSKGLQLIYNSEHKIDRSVVQSRTLQNTDFNSHQWKKVVKMGKFHSNSTSNLLKKSQIKHCLDRKQEKHLLTPVQLLELCRNKNSLSKTQSKTRNKPNFKENYFNSQRIIKQFGV